jgi:hypothetical protein
VKEYAFEVPTQTSSELKMKILSKKIVSATVKFTVSSCFVREGKATDEDMQSLASLMSTGAMMSDIAPLEDLEGEDEDKLSLSEKSRKLSDFTSQIDNLIVGLDESGKKGQGKSQGSPQSSTRDSIDDGSYERKKISPPGLSPISKFAPSLTHPAVKSLQMEESLESHGQSFSLNLTKITEKSEGPESRYQSLLESNKSSSIGESSSLLGDAEQFRKNGSPVKEKSSTRSVFFFLFRCLFPFCR